MLDRLCSQDSQSYRLYWLLLDYPYEWGERTSILILNTPAGPYGAQLAELENEGEFSLVRADKERPLGWRALYYDIRKPALPLALKVKASTVFFWTMFAPEPADVKYDEGSLRIASVEWNTDVWVQSEGSGNPQILCSTSLSGSLENQLDMTQCDSS